MEKTNKNEFIEKLQLILFFAYVLVLYIFGAKADTVMYSEIILMAFMGIEALTILRTKKIKYCIPIIVLFIFVFYCFLSKFWAIYPNISIEKSNTLLLLVTFLLITYNFFINIENGPKKLLKIIMYVGVLFSIYVISYYGVGEYISKLIAGERVGEEINNVNAIGQQTAISVIIAIFFGLYENKKLYYLLAILPLIVALGTGSRKVMGMLLIGVVLLFILKREEKINIIKFTKKMVIFAIIVAIFIWISQLPIFATVFERFGKVLDNIFESGHVYEGEDREVFIRAGIEQFLKTPFLGIGIGNSSYITLNAAGWATYLHNNYVELLACSGIIGFLLYYSVYVYIIWNCIKNLKYKNKYISIALIIILITAIQEYAMVTYSSKTTYLYMLLGLIVVEKNRKRLKDEKNN